MIERDQLAHPQQIGVREQLVASQPLWQLLGPSRGRPAQVSDIPAGEGRQTIDSLGPRFRKSRPQGIERPVAE